MSRLDARPLDRAGQPQFRRTEAEAHPANHPPAASVGSESRPDALEIDNGIDIERVVGVRTPMPRKSRGIGDAATGVDTDAPGNCGASSLIALLRSSGCSKSIVASRDHVGQRDGAEHDRQTVGRLARGEHAAVGGGWFCAPGLTRDPCPGPDRRRRRVRLLRHPGRRPTARAANDASRITPVDRAARARSSTGYPDAPAQGIEDLVTSWSYTGTGRGWGPG